MNCSGNPSGSFIIYNNDTEIVKNVADLETQIAEIQIAITEQESSIMLLEQYLVKNIEVLKDAMGEDYVKEYVIFFCYNN